MNPNRLTNILCLFILIIVAAGLFYLYNKIEQMKQQYKPMSFTAGLAVGLIAMAICMFTCNRIENQERGADLRPAIINSK